MLPLVDADWQRLAQARIACRRDDAGLQYLINTVPAKLKDDPGLAYERYLYRVSKGRWQDAEVYLLRASHLRRGAGRAGPLDGAPRQPGAAGAGGRRRARRLSHRGAELRQRGIGVRRFRVGGRVYRADAARRPEAGDRSLHPLPRRRSPRRSASAAPATGSARLRAGRRHGGGAGGLPPGAENQTSFYGQLAAEKLASPPDARLAGGGEVPDWRDAAVHDLVGDARRRCCSLAGDDRRASQFLRHAAEDEAGGNPGGAGADGDRYGRAGDRHPHRQGRRGRRDHHPRPVLPAAPHRRRGLAGADRVCAGDRPAGVGVRRRGGQHGRRARADAADAGHREHMAESAGVPFDSRRG